MSSKIDALWASNIDPEVDAVRKEMIDLHKLDARPKTVKVGDELRPTGELAKVMNYTEKNRFHIFDAPAPEPDQRTKLPLGIKGPDHMYFISVFLYQLYPKARDGDRRGRQQLEKAARDFDLISKYWIGEETQEPMTQAETDRLARLRHKWDELFSHPFLGVGAHSLALISSERWKELEDQGETETEDEFLERLDEDHLFFVLYYGQSYVDSHVNGGAKGPRTVAHYLERLSERDMAQMILKYPVLAKMYRPSDQNMEAVLQQYPSLRDIYFPAKQRRRR